jgi:hypothetical protein
MRLCIGLDTLGRLEEVVKGERLMVLPLNIPADEFVLRS